MFFSKSIAEERDPLGRIPFLLKRVNGLLRRSQNGGNGAYARARKIPSFENRGSSLVLSGNGAGILLVLSPTPIVTKYLAQQFDDLVKLISVPIYVLS